MRIEWSPRAERELTQLRDYIAQDSPFYARQFTERLIHAVERLTSMPRSGRTVPDAGHQDAIREVIFRSYRVIYRIHDEQLLQIVTVFHGAQDLAGMEPPWQPPAPKTYLSPEAGPHAGEVRGIAERIQHPQIGTAADSGRLAA